MKYLVSTIIGNIKDETLLNKPIIIPMDKLQNIIFRSETQFSVQIDNHAVDCGVGMSFFNSFETALEEVKLLLKANIICQTPSTSPPSQKKSE